MKIPSLGSSDFGANALVEAPESNEVEMESYLDNNPEVPGDFANPK